jgi:hypothetical protein
MLIVCFFLINYSFLCELNTMHNTAVISILKSLSKDELKEFDKFIISPFFNNQPSLTRFYKQLRTFHPDFTGSRLERKTVFGKLYPDKEYSDATIRRLCSDLKKVLDDYIYYKAGENARAEAGFIKASEYIRRGLNKEAEREMEQIDKVIDSSGLISHEYIKNRLEYEDLTVQLLLQRNRQDLAMGNFMNETEFLIYHFVTRLAYYVHNLRVNKLIFNSSGSRFAEEFISSIDFEKISRLADENREEGANPEINHAIRIYILFLLNNVDDKEEKYFFELKKLLPQVINKFSPHERYNLYQLAEAICWRKMEIIDREKYRREMFEINKQRLRDGVFSPDGKNMRLMLYRQVLITSLHLKEFNWAEEFVAEYSPKLPEDIKDSMKKFSEAHILFEKGDYHKSLGLLNKVDFEIFTLKFDLRNLMLRIYIELNYIEEAISLMDSYKHFTSNNKNVSDYYREITNNFLKYCKKIIDLRNNGSAGVRSGKEEVIQELLKENMVNFKAWLLEKLQ